MQRKCSVKGLRQTPGLKVDLGQPHRSELYLPGQVQNVAAAEITGYIWSVCAGLYVDRAPPSKDGHTSDHSSSGQAQSELGVITLAVLPDRPNVTVEHEHELKIMLN